jgi:tetratricopeptide (TPR) repeat protein
LPLPKSYLQACVDLVRGDAGKARAEFEAARPAIEKTVVNSPQDGVRHAQLGLLYAFLGRKEDALREGQRAMELKPITHDVIEGAVVEDFYTLTCARLGESDKAISRIERLLTTPFGVDYADESITLSDLRQRWEWDPLRKDARFKKSWRDPNQRLRTIKDRHELEEATTDCIFAYSSAPETSPLLVSECACRMHSVWRIL